ncbi:lytic transglycosylase domain-containing protein [Auritidibacter ignavus]|uniref:lytic transglycosylase domain-containing protein n=1 Tax=Auritidibacter ignavus TaxID=678932 RepID=UPI0021074118|nr:lytic murein transglycosylase [Auritidibacter ignavus]
MASSQRSTTVRDLLFGSLAVLILLIIVAFGVLAFRPDWATKLGIGPTTGQDRVAEMTDADKAQASATIAPMAAVDAPGAESTARDATQTPDKIDPDWLHAVSEATGIPPRALSAYASADRRVREEQQCAVGWNTLAGIGWIESQHGTLQGGSVADDGRVTPKIYGVPLDGTGHTAHVPDTDGGELDQNEVYDRAVGPMQFIPETWARWGADGSGDGVADPHQIDDAAYTAARYLCHSRAGLEGSQEWIAAIRSYNNSVPYQADVAATAERYRIAATEITAS